MEEELKNETEIIDEIKNINHDESIVPLPSWDLEPPTENNRGEK